jgi:hypothetical protein
MLFRSTGLGKTELKAKVNGVVRQGDYLILQVETLEPVKWKIRACISLKDMWAVIRSVLKPSNLKLVLSNRWFKEAQHPGEF